MCDGIVAYSDAIAVGALRALHEHAIRVPEQVSLVGFDALTIGLVPKLTSVGVAWYRVALTALESLIDMMGEDHATPAVHRFEPELVRGESACPAASDRLRASGA